MFLNQLNSFVGEIQPDIHKYVMHELLDHRGHNNGRVKFIIVQLLEFCRWLARCRCTCMWRYWRCLSHHHLGTNQERMRSRTAAASITTKSFICVFCCRCWWWSWLTFFCAALFLFDSFPMNRIKFDRWRWSISNVRFPVWRILTAKVDKKHKKCI